MSDLPPLVADGGELRLARRVASYVYGRREVTWPEDVDDPEDSLPDEREFGWVAKLPGPEPGLSERRFVRGDVDIDAVEQVSNVEQVLDDAATRAGGDVFFESLIEGRGLGRLKPGVDFDEGDLVDVRFWGRVLPDQLVTSIEWHDDTPSVKIGGQLTSDTSELARARAETVRLINRERREREDDVGAVSAAASAAQSTANVARDEVQAVRDTLAGEQSGEPDLLAQLVAVNDELQRLGQEPQPSLMLAFVQLSTALWEAQRVLDAAQDDFAAQTREQAESQAELINAVQAQIGEVSQASWSLGWHGDGFWEVSGSTVTAVGSWVGEAILDVTTTRDKTVVESVSSSGNDSKTTIQLESRSVRRVDVGTDRSWSFGGTVSASIFHYRKAAGTVKKWSQAIARMVAGVSWTRLAGFTAEDSAPHSVDYTIGWDAAHRGATYGVRVVVDGVVHKTLSTTTLGPVFPIGSGYRTQQVSVTLDLVPGQVVEFQALCDYPGESQRTVRDGSARVWWVEN